MEEVVQYSQLAIVLLADHPRECYHVWSSVLVSDVDRSGTQQQLQPGQPCRIEVQVVKPIYNPRLSTTALCSWTQ